MEEFDLEYFQKRILSGIEKVFKGGRVLFAFQDEMKQSIIKNLLPKNHSVFLFTDGGFEKAEYQRVLLTSDQSDTDCSVQVYEIEYPSKFFVLTHRMVLGALMGLGIERESIGDIVVQKDGRVFFACTKEISPYLEKEFTQISKAKIRLKKTTQRISVFKEANHQKLFVSSLRIDVLLSAAYHISRKTAQEMIEAKEVLLNHLPVSKPTIQVKPNEIVSVRHKGRIWIEEILGSSASGRIVLNLGMLK